MREKIGPPSEINVQLESFTSSQRKLFDEIMGVMGKDDSLGPSPDQPVRLYADAQRGFFLRRAAFMRRAGESDYTAHLQVVFEPDKWDPDELRRIPSVQESRGQRGKRTERQKLSQASFGTTRRRRSSASQTWALPNRRTLT